MSSQDRPRTTGKKIANSIVGKSIFGEARYRGPGVG
jgi:hypothetical protein